jgi:hypothetical protein
VGGGSPEKRTYDVSHGQNRYVRLPYKIVESRGLRAILLPEKKQVKRQRFERRLFVGKLANG